MRKKQQRKSYTTEFKVKIALEAIKGQRTINEIATHYGVHPNLVTQWKKHAVAILPDVFSLTGAQKPSALLVHVLLVNTLVLSS
jgi:hypothetical protein